MYKVRILKDEPGYIALVEDVDNIYAWWNTPEEAIKELENVISMMEDLEKERLKKISKIKASLKFIDVDKCLIDMKSLQES